MPKCPVCGSELIEVGYPRDFYQKYRCPNDCEFEPLLWRIRNALELVTVVVLFIFTFIFILPFVALGYLYKTLRRVGS